MRIPKRFEWRFGGACRGRWFVFFLGILLGGCGGWAIGAETALTGWRGLDTAVKPLSLENGRVTLVGPSETKVSGGWNAFVSGRAVGRDAMVSAVMVIEERAKQFGYFGASWSVWPDARVADQGFDAGLLLCLSEDGSRGYRVQFSVQYGTVALVRIPDGGYVRSVPCRVQVGVPMRVGLAVSNGIVRVMADGVEMIRYVDSLAPALEEGMAGVCASSSARVTFSDVTLGTSPVAGSRDGGDERGLKLGVRRWVGDRDWVFDGDEPILLLPTEKASSVMNVKLKRGFKPLLTWNSHWDTQNQGAYREATLSTENVRWQGGGESLTVEWKGRHVDGRFGTETRMQIGFDWGRGTYTYDIESGLEVFSGDAFDFRYGFDFEHHTPLDPFQWQNLMVRKSGGELYRRPVTSVDPGPQYDVETYHGMRVWHGRYNGDFRVAPAVEYDIAPEWIEKAGTNGSVVRRQMNTAVCAAFYDTGVAFAPEKAAPGTKLRVKYRYTGYPREEADLLFGQSKTYESATLDPAHHYIFADEWPRLTFSQFVPLSEPWIKGRTPFMTGHNQRPSYELVKDCGVGSGFAMALGPTAYGKASLPKAGLLAKGKYEVSAWVKSENVIGEGGRMEVELLDAKTRKSVAEFRHFVGAGTFGWRREGFVFEVLADETALAVAFGNSGTGRFLVADVEFRALSSGSGLSDGVLAEAKAAPAWREGIPAGAVVDYRMTEGQGFFVLNHAASARGSGSSLDAPLELVNVDWVRDEGRSAIRFADNAGGGERFHPTGYVGMHIFGNARDFQYLASYRSYEKARTRVFAMGGGGAVVLGCERYYLHSSYYRGLLGRVQIFRRGLGDAEVNHLSNNQELSSEFGTNPSRDVTISAWIKPAARLGNEDKHPGIGDIVGFGNRKFILRLTGSGDRNECAPYRLAARLNVNDGVASEPLIAADRWYHVALTATVEGDQRRMRLFLNGKEVSSGLTTKWVE